MLDKIKILEKALSYSKGQAPSNYIKAQLNYIYNFYLCYDEVDYNEVIEALETLEVCEDHPTPVVGTETLQEQKNFIFYCLNNNILEPDNGLYHKARIIDYKIKKES